MTFLYRLLIRLYPQEYRARFQNEMLHVLAANATESREKGRVQRGLLATHEVTGLLLGVLRERRSTTPARREAPTYSLRAPVAVLSLYILCTWTIVDLGIHALFSPISYAVLLGGILLGLWLVSSQRVLGTHRNRVGLIALTLFFWLGLPFGLSLSERYYQAQLHDNPVEFSYRYPGGAVQALIASPNFSVKSAGRAASELIPLADNRSLMLVMTTENDAPPYRILIPAFLMGLSFLWRRRHSRLAVTE